MSRLSFHIPKRDEEDLGEVIDDRYLRLDASNGPITGDLDFDGNKITGLGTPSGNADVATKKYVDDTVGAGGGGDMLKSTYDTDDDGYVNGAESLNDGANTASAADVSTHLAADSKHREINDGGSAVTDIWSADKIDTELSGKLSDITGESVGDLSDVDVTGVASNKVLKYNATSSAWEIGDDSDTTYIAGDFNHDDLANIPAGDHIDWTQSGAGTIHADNYVDNDTTYTAGTGMSLVGTQFDCDITQYTDADAVAAIKGDVDWDATNWDTAYSWGDHSSAGYLSDITGEGINDLSDVDTTGIANDKILKYNATNSAWEIADDVDTDTTYTAGTGLSLEGTEFSSDITQYTDSDAVSAIQADASWNATNWDTAHGWGDHGAAGYLTSVGEESINSLLDVDTTGIADNKILKYNSTSSAFEIGDDNDTTYTASDFDHGDLTNTHNLTTDIDHDTLTNFEAGEHYPVIDEDNMVSDSDSHVPTQQSVKAYIDSEISALREQINSLTRIG